MKSLTDKQKNMIDFIEEFININGMAPTVYEIADKFSIKTSTVFAHLRALQRKKQLTRSSKARSISIINKTNRAGQRLPGAITIPLLGRVNAGMPTESIEHKDGEVYVSAQQVKKYQYEQLFALRIQGESMRDLGIYEGDVVVVAHTDTAPKAGDIVVALLQGGEVTVKSFFKKTNGMIELRPANPDFKPLLYLPEDIQIQGKVIALQRAY